MDACPTWKSLKIWTSNAFLHSEANTCTCTCKIKIIKHIHVHISLKLSDQKYEYTMHNTIITKIVAQGCAKFCCH